MGQKFAVIIAVENYKDLKWNRVHYATADATELSEAIADIGFAKENQQFLINDDATKARIDSRLRRVVDDLQEDDELLIYYAGHGFAEGRSNYLTCYDSERHDLERTSIALQDVFDFIRSSECKKIMLFLDSCHSGPVTRQEDRGLLQDMTEAELSDFFARSEYFVCFASCRTSEKSYPSDKHGHGIWTYHLLEALRGDAPEAIERNGLITSRSLQAFLANKVPLTLRNVRTNLVTQKPVLYGSMTGEFAVADISRLLAARQASQASAIPTLKRVLMRAERTLKVKSLSGFKSTHRVPTEVNSYTENWVAKISRADLDAEVDEAHTLLRNVGYRRSQIEAQVEDGSAIIHTPDFSLELTLSLDPDQPSNVVLRTQLVNITKPELVMSDQFHKSFRKTFSMIEFEYDKPFDVESVIDMLEQNDDQRVQLQYPHDASYCRVSIEGVPYSLLVTAGSVQLEFSKAGSPRQLLEGLREASQFMLSEQKVHLLPSS